MLHEENPDRQLIAAQPACHPQLIPKKIGARTSGYSLTMVTKRLIWCIPNAKRPVAPDDWGAFKLTLIDELERPGSLTQAAAAISHFRHGAHLAESVR